MAKKETKKKSEISCDVEEIYCKLSNKKIYARVSWNGKDAKDEIRKCWEDKDGQLQIGKGVDITDEDIKMLYDTMKHKPKPVDFDEIFEESKGLTALREAGLKTEDGFIKLKRTLIPILIWLKRWQKNCSIEKKT